MTETTRERDERLEAYIRQEAFLDITIQLQKARQAMNRAPASIRHTARFTQDLALMMDAIEAQRHE